MGDGLVKKTHPRSAGEVNKIKDEMSNAMTSEFKATIKWEHAVAEKNNDQPMVCSGIEKKRCVQVLRRSYSRHS